MKDKSTKKIKFTPEHDSQRETKVLLESIRTEVKIVAEGHSVINNKLDRIESEFDTIKSEFSIIKSELNSVKMAVMDVNHQVKILKSDTQILKSDTQTLKVEAQEIKQKLDAVIVDHEQRLCKLEVIK